MHTRAVGRSENLGGGGIVMWWAPSAPFTLILIEIGLMCLPKSGKGQLTPPAQTGSDGPAH